MLKAQVFQLERSNALLSDKLNSQHETLTAVLSGLDALKELLASLDAGQRTPGMVLIPTDILAQIKTQVERLSETRSRKGRS
eukprot:CAMPEP_0206060018 /NCGR_PEP_ID=MMETSP1466-20131121/50312_1 /ASSEMBLY_ACC=CAM_ASM_001126 /TAXON_ID=44452 /ORGANISM="Pavlova gyrans, Strain CCMP608" /LENGTH=81 /DNA_ID=CAMNT_0053435351 /DNA_START=12 /DNA_END=257 /DNA_ORIENTATION=-